MDYILTFAREVEHIWKREYSASAMLFCLVRYSGLVNTLFVVLVETGRTGISDKVHVASHVENLCYSPRLPLRSDTIEVRLHLKPCLCIERPDLLGSACRCSIMVHVAWILNVVILSAAAGKASFSVFCTAIFTFSFCISVLRPQGLCVVLERQASLRVCPAAGLHTSRYPRRRPSYSST